MVSSSRFTHLKIYITSKGIILDTGIWNRRTVCISTLNILSYIYRSAYSWNLNKENMPSSLIEKSPFDPMYLTTRLGRVFLLLEWLASKDIRLILCRYLPRVGEGGEMGSYISQSVTSTRMHDFAIFTSVYWTLYSIKIVDCSHSGLAVQLMAVLFPLSLIISVLRGSETELTFMSPILLTNCSIMEVIVTWHNTEARTWMLNLLLFFPPLFSLLFLLLETCYPPVRVSLLFFLFFLPRVDFELCQ